MNDYPTIKLKPGKGWRLAAGAPWVFADEVAMDRRTRKIERGTLVRLAEGERALGVAGFNAESQIAVRLLDADPDVVVDGAWLVARLQTALAFRERLYDAPFYRLVHAEGDGLPGVVIDRFGDVAVIQPNAAWADKLIEVLSDPAAQMPLRKAARQSIIDRYDLQTVCLPKLLDFVETAGKPG